MLHPAVTAPRRSHQGQGRVCEQWREEGGWARASSSPLLPKKAPRGLDFLSNLCKLKPCRALGVNLISSILILHQMGVSWEMCGL